MLHNCLRWFYCLPIPQAFLLMVIFSVLFLFLRKMLEKKRFWQLGVSAFVLLWIILIIAATLMSRSFAESRITPVPIPFSSYYSVFNGGNKELLRSCFMNVALFYPAGLSACALLPENWRRTKKVLFVSLLLALLSAGIECCQYFFALGQAEADDVIHNALGAFLGAFVCTIRFKSETTTSAEDDIN